MSAKEATVAKDTMPPTMEYLGKGKAKKAAAAPVVEEKKEAATIVEEAKAAVKAPEKTKKAETGDLINDLSAQLENLKEEEALSTAKALIAEEDFNDFKLGGVISVIQSNGFWEGKGYENFAKWIEGELGIPYRKAMHLKDIYTGLVESGVPYEKVKSLGWSKLKELAFVLTKENVDKWVEIASASTVLQLIEAIKASKAAPVTASGTPAVTTDEAAKVSTMTFKVHPDQKEDIRAALDKAKKDYGTEFDTVALHNIVMAYIEQGTGKPVATKSLADMMTEAGWEKVIDTFGNLFPDIDITVGAPS